MKYLFFSLLLFGSVCLTQAQIKAQDPEAEPWLDRVAQMFTTDKTLVMEFAYKREDQQTQEQVTGNGTLFLKREMYRVDLDNFVLYFDGKYQYSQNNDAEEVYVSQPDPEDKEMLFSDPVRLLRNYRENFKYYVAGESTFEGKKALEIQLNPVDISGPYAMVKIFMDRSTNNLSGIQIRHKEGILYTMVPGTIKKDQDKPDTWFRFNPQEFKGYELIELVD
ncbi:MAG: LolA family protein [Bacteroidota bacterium]